MNRSKDGHFESGNGCAGMREIRRDASLARRLILGLACSFMVLCLTDSVAAEPGPLVDVECLHARVGANQPGSLARSTGIREPIALAMGPVDWSGFTGAASFGMFEDHSPLAEADTEADTPSQEGDPAPSVTPTAETPKAGGQPEAVEQEEASPPAKKAGKDAVRATEIFPMGEALLGAGYVDRSADSLISSIRLSGERAEQIIISKNSTAVIDLKVPVDRVEITNEDVANFEVLSEKRISITGKEFGSTQMVLWAGKQRRAFNILVELDLGLLESYIKSTEPMASVRPLSINGKVVLSGTVPDARSAERIVELAGLLQGGDVKNQLQVAGVQQAMLRVVVAEVNQDALRQLGVNWAIGASDWSRDFFFSNNVGGIAPTAFGSSGVGNVLTGQQLYAAAPNAAVTHLTFGFPRAEFQVFMNALRQNDLARTLAEPNLVAISGQTATFLAGGEVPIPVRQGVTTGGITIEYKEFGVRLGFTPTVMAGQLMRLHIMTEVSEAIPGVQVAGGLPTFTFTTRRVESTIECGNGHTFAIAGLLSEEVRATASKIPGLGDVPILGALFSSTEYRKSNTELIVLVTPELVEPLDPQQVPPPPGSLMTHPTDYELFALQQLEGPRRLPVEQVSVPRERFPVRTRPGNSTGWPNSQLALRGPWGFADSGEF